MEYQTYLKAYREKGINGLYDHREDGNAKKITPEIERKIDKFIMDNFPIVDEVKPKTATLKKLIADDITSSHTMKSMTLYPKKAYKRLFLYALYFATGKRNRNNTFSDLIADALIFS